MAWSYEQKGCPVARTLDVIGERWTILILRDLLLKGGRRFQDLQESLAGVAPNTLSARLKDLEEKGIVERKLYSEHPPRFDYRLTEKGRDLWPVITAMRQWGDRHAAPDGPPMELIHTRCGHVSQATVTCSECGEPMGPRDVRATPGPGAV